MSRVRLFIFGIFLATAGLLTAGNAVNDYDFNQDRLMATTANVMMVSSFDTADHITAYNEYGTRLWNVTFYPKIISWKLKDGLLYVFSKSRQVEATYLTCIDPMSGAILWERP